MTRVGPWSSLFIELKIGFKTVQSANKIVVLSIFQIATILTMFHAFLVIWKKEIAYFLSFIVKKLFTRRRKEKKILKFFKFKDRQSRRRKKDKNNKLNIMSVKSGRRRRYCWFWFTCYELNKNMMRQRFSLASILIVYCHKKALRIVY